MAQQQIIAYLEERRGQKFTVLELSQAMNYTIDTINRSVNRLIRYNLCKHGIFTVKFQTNNRGTQCNVFKGVRKVWLPRKRQRTGSTTGI